MIFNTGSKLEKHQAYLDLIKAEIEYSEKQKVVINKKLEELYKKFDENKDFIPKED